MRSETEVAAVVMDRLIEEGWDCYPEVKLPAGGRADIVGVCPRPVQSLTMIVECKTSWTLSLLEQGERALQHAHYVMLAAPTLASPFYRSLCHRAGIGMIAFERAFDLRIDVHRCTMPKRIPHRQRRSHYFGPAALLGVLHEDQKRYEPGSTAAAGFSTPWRRTMDAAARYVAEHPGATIAELVSNIDYHYSSVSSAKQGLLKWLAQRDDVAEELDGRRLRYYPVTQ